MNARRDLPKLHDVYCYENGQVLAFDQFGAQMPLYQGKKIDVWPLIEAAFARDPFIRISGASHPLEWKGGSLLREQPR